MAVNKLTSPISQNDLINKTNEIIDNLGGGGTVDQTYDPTSANAQSGVAINGAGFLQNTATGTNSLTVGGLSATDGNSTNIGIGSAVNGDDSIAIGNGAITTASYKAIQLGNGVNSTPWAFNVGFGYAADQTTQINYQLLDGTTGYIPNGRLLGLLQTIYPVGSLYLTVNNTCPLAALFGTWQSVATSIITSVGSTTSTSATVSVKGNGYSMGLMGGSSGSATVGLQYHNAMVVARSVYGSTLGTASATNLNPGSYVMGLSTDTSKSGVTGSVTIPSLTPSKTSLTCYIFKRTA